MKQFIIKSFVGFTAGLVALTLVAAPVMAQQYYYSGYNSGPVWDNINDTSVLQGQTLSLVVRAIDNDNDQISYTVITAPKNANFNPATRIFTFTPDFSQLGTYAVTLSATDGKSSPLRKTFYVTVNPNNLYGMYYSNGGNSNYPNQAPYFSGTRTYFTINANERLEFQVRATDPEGSSVFYTAAGLPQNAFFDEEEGRFSWTPSSAQRGTFTLSFYASDGFITSTPITVTIVVGQVYAQGIGYSYNNNSYNPYANYTANAFYPYNTYPQNVVTQPVTVQNPVVSAPSPVINYVYRDVPGKNTIKYVTTPAEPIKPTYQTTYAAAYDNYYPSGAVVVNAGRTVPTYPVTAAVASYGSNYGTYAASAYGGATVSPIASFNLAVRVGVAGDMIVSWDTSVPTRSEVVYGYSSHARSDAWNTVLNYDFTSGEKSTLTTRHEMSLGKLQIGRTYYMRAISRTDNATDLSREIVFIPMQTVDNVPQVQQYDGAASATNSVGSFVTSAGFLTFLGLIVLALIIYMIYMAFAGGSRKEFVTEPEIHIHDQSAPH